MFGWWCCCEKQALVAGYGTSSGDGKPNVYAFDGSSGSILWTYSTGYSGAALKLVQGITKDGDGNIYLAYYASTTSYGIQKLDSSGNLLQDWSPSGWVVASWDSGVPGVSGSAVAGNPSTLYYDANSNSLFWQHIGRQNGGTTVYDCISQLDLSFTELASYGASNFSTAWNSSANTPSLPGKVMTDSEGNILNEFGTDTKTNSCLCKISAAGSLLFNHKTTAPIASSSWSYKTHPAGVQNNGFFDINPAQGTSGYLGLAVSPDFTAQNSDQAHRLQKTAGGSSLGWCGNSVVNDNCGNSIGGLAPNKQTVALILDNHALTNVAGQSPVAQKSYCDFTWGHGDRIYTGQTHNPATGIAYGANTFFICLNGTYVLRETPVSNRCTSDPVQNFVTNCTDQDIYGLMSIDATTGTMLSLRSMSDITGGSNTTGFDSLRSPAYFGSKSYIIAAGTKVVSASNHIAVYAFDSALSTQWFYDFTSNSTNIGAVTCTYADPT